MIFNIDIDGVLRNFNDAVYREYKKAYPDHEVSPTVKEWSLLNRYPIGEEIHQFIWDKHPHDIFLGADPYPQAIDALRKIHSGMNRIQLVTATHGSAVIPTIQWLEKYKVPFDALHFTRRKETVACDILIDDKPDNLHAAKNVDQMAIAFRRPWNKPWKGLSISSWDDLKPLMNTIMQRKTS